MQPLSEGFPNGVFGPLLGEWPKILASGIAIPILQFVVRWLWEKTQSSRIARLRKELIEVQAFVNQIDLTAGNEQIRRTRDAAQRDLATLLDRLNRAALPFAEAHPRLKRVLSKMLFSIPPYPIGWLIRISFYGFIIAEVAGVAGLFSAEPSDDSWWWYLIGIGEVILINAWGQAADGISGEIISRRWWKRILLLYKPVSKTAGLFQVAFWVYLPIGVRALVDSIDESDVLGVLLVIAFATLLWWSATHFDRDRIARQYAVAPSAT